MVINLKFKNNEKILVSACLFGVNCKYNGKNNENEKIIKSLKNCNVILVCPEQLGGLATPRIPAEISHNKVITKDGTDVTYEYTKGAMETLNIAKKFSATKAILKSKSPSCGKNKIYDGTFSSTLTNESGITAKLLMQNDIEVISSDEI